MSGSAATISMRKPGGRVKVWSDACGESTGAGRIHSAGGGFWTRPEATSRASPIWAARGTVESAETDAKSRKRVAAFMAERGWGTFTGARQKLVEFAVPQPTPST